uniref:Lysozyme 3-like n=1 Tax=Crassostrea virginica TaxID=6565 RepID=A0A8B8E3B4_CRAVI|nr:lysozyme 3-like [Crassostrea virginica]
MAGCAMADEPGSAVSPTQMFLVVVIIIDVSSTVADRPCVAKGGKCQQNTLTCSGDYERGLCGGSSARQCCVPRSGSTSCSAAATALACKIKNSSKISLLTTNPSGVNDGADPNSNIRDACAGKKVKRSSYRCSEGQAPGGTTCLDAKILQYIYDLGTSTKYKVQCKSGIQMAF